MTVITDPHPALGSLIDLTGQTAIVTGGAMGIGEAIVRRLHEAGAGVVIADRDPCGKDLSAELNDMRPQSAVSVQADVADADDVARVVAEAQQRFGAVDILVNNAGIYPSVRFTEMDADLFRHILDVNLLGVFLCTQAVVADMRRRGQGGRVINITSIDALHPSMVGLASYDASKHGVWGLTKNVALELASDRIWVNAIAPGGVATPGVGEMSDAVSASFATTIPMGRMGDPDDIARATLFLASDLSSYMTGSQIVVDGGKLLT
jgi:2-deoxy-D-gluconate 3-dehydrogenase